MTTTLQHAPTKGGGLARRQNFLTALISGVVFAFVAWYIARHTLDSSTRTFSDQVAVLVACGWTVGFWLGIGALNGPGRWLIGRDHSRADDLYYAGENLGRAMAAIIKTKPVVRSD